LKRIWLYSVRKYISIGLFFYFKDIQIHNAKNLPKNKPVLLLCNHQNALLDALLIGAKCGKSFYFLTRAAAFKKKFVGAILKSLQMLPIYRIRDGLNTLSNNNAIFEACTEILHKNKAVAIFPEGDHNLERRVRPLKKGFTRIVLDTLEKYPDTDIQLIPVGVNYVKAENFPDSTSVFFGNPIAAKDFISDDKNADVINLKAKIHTEISKLTTHISSDNYDEALNKLDALNVNYLNPSTVNNCIASNFEVCEQRTKSKINGIRLFLKGLLILNILLPYLVWRFFVKPKIKDIEFTSTFRFVIVITLVPLYLIIITLVLSFIFSLKLAILYVLCVLILSLITVKL